MQFLRTPFEEILQETDFSHPLKFEFETAKVMQYPIAIFSIAKIASSLSNHSDSDCNV